MEGHTVQKIKANPEFCGVRRLMDFVPGDVLESRRGGVDVLRHLAQELATLERNGSIQIKRSIPNVGERTGHLLIFDGTLAAAFHHADTARYGIEALLEIESDASTLDATMSLHEMTESTYISTLSQYPDASLISSAEESKDEAWWTTVRTPRRTIEREERLPEIKPSVAIPEALRRKSEARIRNLGGPVLQQGQAWLEHSIEPDEVFHLAHLLTEMNHPTLILSRQSPPRMETNYNINLQHYRWLSETEHAHTLEPSLESIRRSVDAFFEQYNNGVLFLEGIEYLSGIHGEQRVIEMVRSIVDQTRSIGSMFIVSSNLEAFTTQQRSRLQREFSRLEGSQIQSWVLDVELLKEHPFFSALDHEVEAAVNQHIEDNVQDPIVASKQEIVPHVHQAPSQVEHQTMKVDDELQSKMLEWAKGSEEDIEAISEIEQEPITEEIEPMVESKPRTPQRIVRKRKKMAQSSKRSSIDAAAERNISLPSLPSPDTFEAKPFVPIASTPGKKTAQFPPIKATGLVPTAVSNPKQSTSNIEASPHAREQASLEQRLSDEYDLEDNA